MSIEFGYVIVYVKSVLETIAFYERAFGFTESFVHESGQFGQLNTGQTKLAFTSHELGKTAVPIPYRPTNPVEDPLGFELTLTTPEVDATWQRALDAGATDVASPHDTPWGQRVAYLRDLNGALVGIATPMG